MALRDTLRKAASLLVELPPEESGSQAPGQPRTTASELDQLLAELDSGTGGSATASGQPAPSRPVDQIVREADGPNLDEIQVRATAVSPISSADGKMYFTPISQQSGLPPAPFTAEQMLEMLTSLPAELPLDTKRQTVKVTLG